MNTVVPSTLVPPSAAAHLLTTAHRYPHPSTMVGNTPVLWIDHARTDSAVGKAVDEDEATGVTVADVRVERDRSIETEVAHTDFVERESSRCGLLESVDVDRSESVRTVRIACRAVGARSCASPPVWRDPRAYSLLLLFCVTAGEQSQPGPST